MATATMKKLDPVVAVSTDKKAPAKKKSPVAVVRKKAEVSATAKPAGRSKPAAKTADAKTPASAKTPTEMVGKVKKPKLVRDSFTMPESEYAALGAVKKACLKAGIEVKKSQLLRIGVALLSKTEIPNLKKLIAGLEPLKAGRPKKEK